MADDSARQGSPDDRRAYSPWDAPAGADDPPVAAPTERPVGRKPKPPPSTSCPVEPPGVTPPPPPDPPLVEAVPPAPPAAGRPPGGQRRPVLIAVAVGALIGAVVAGAVVAATKDDRSQSAAIPGTSSDPSKSSPVGDVQGILARVEPAVVSIRTRSLGLGDFLRPVPGEGAGTGFVVGTDGIIVTNNHVVTRAQSIEVVLADGRTMRAQVLGRDPSSDLAVLKIDATGLAVAALGDSDALRVGDDVIAIGNALALAGGPTVTRGIVSAKERTISAENGARLEHLLQTDTAINPGNSGGPLVNSAGEVVGINTAVAGKAQNIGFSIAITAAKPIIDDLRQGATRSRPYLGVNMFTVTPSVAEELDLDVDSGALVAELTAASPAELAGLRNGDVITAINGKEIKTSEDVTSALKAHKPRDRVKVTVRRRDQTKSFDVTLGERPADVD